MCYHCPSCAMLNAIFDDVTYKTLITPNSAYAQQHLCPTVPIPNCNFTRSCIYPTVLTAHSTCTQHYNTLASPTFSGSPHYNHLVATNITNIKSQQTLQAFSRNKHYEHSVATRITNIQSQQTLQTFSRNKCYAHHNK